MSQNQAVEALKNTQIDGNVNSPGPSDKKLPSNKGSTNTCNTCTIEIPSISELFSNKNISHQSVPYETCAPVCFSPAETLSFEDMSGYSFCNNNIISSVDESFKCFMKQIGTDLSKYFVKVPQGRTEEILITNLPVNVPRKDIYELCSKMHPKKIDVNIVPGSKGSYARVQVENVGECQSLLTEINNKVFFGNKLSAILVNNIW